MNRIVTRGYGPTNLIITRGYQGAIITEVWREILRLTSKIGIMLLRVSKLGKILNLESELNLEEVDL